METSFSLSWRRADAARVYFVAVADWSVYLVPPAIKCLGRKLVSLTCISDGITGVDVMEDPDQSFTVRRRIRIWSLRLFLLYPWPLNGPQCTGRMERLMGLLQFVRIGLVT